MNPITERVTIKPRYPHHFIAGILVLMCLWSLPLPLAVILGMCVWLVDNYFAVRPYLDRFFDPSDCFSPIFLLVVQGVFGTLVGLVAVVLNWALGLHFPSPFWTTFILAPFIHWSMEFTMYRERP